MRSGYLGRCSSALSDGTISCDLHVSAPVIRIAISAEAFDAICATLPFGSVVYDDGPNDHGERLIWLAPNVLDRLKAMRGPQESYSDVILRLAKATEPKTKRAKR